MADFTQSRLRERERSLKKLVLWFVGFQEVASRPNNLLRNTTAQTLQPTQYQFTALTTAERKH